MMNGLTPDEQASLVGSAVRAANVGSNPYDDVVSTMTWRPPTIRSAGSSTTTASSISRGRRS